MTKAIVFDLGAVLIDWNPHHLYKQLFASEDEMKYFLSNITTMDWNEEQDMGRSLQEGTDILVAQHPEHEANIRAYYGRWEEMLGGVIEGTEKIFQQLKASGKYEMLALSNWSAETFVIAQERYEVLNQFDGVVVSGIEKTRKPFPEFYQIMLDRYQLKPEECLFIDDNLRNVKAAEAMGIPSILFVGAEELGGELRERGIL
ncbi:HAD family hydrolase [Mucilaginibacter myungsuensis]|uniref:HAD family phosphatase n=1 Tax=Mucilaginibacter myungsuensis TaxID=649104 RepID=A0A929L629_9SPHI|nr:HAD family phosphatase [Mucilaginibacter myungsuensis]MBE9663871.1 HAD family phosphatase [Mucilaginibacter myungsuensis]MDN3598413.1 HAD family phosphatase [Mucilaginibacter myungsuensis]